MGKSQTEIRGECICLAIIYFAIDCITEKGEGQIPFQKTDCYGRPWMVVTRGEL